MRKVVLASGSEQRKLILGRLGVPFIVDVSGVDEDLPKRLPPRALVRELALRKALAVAVRHPDAIIIGADTVLAVGERVFGKQENAAAVRRTLRFMRGKKQKAWSGVAVIDTKSGKRAVFSVSTDMRIRMLTDREIERYARSGEWKGKAGGYSVIGAGSTFVDSIRGNYNNIIGLPVPELISALGSFGIDV